jgi:hypothetical protein
MWLLAAGGCFSSDDGGGGGAAAGSGRDTVEAAAQDLTNALMLADGKVVDGDIPEVTAADVTVTEGGDTLELVPGETDILPLGVDNPDEDANPVAAALLQFEGSNDHIRADGMNMGGMVEQMYSVGDDACDDLCAKVYRITMYEAVELEDGSVSERAVQTVDLDCREHGDPECGGGGGGGAGGAGGDPGGESGSGGTGGGSGGTGGGTLDPDSPAGRLKNSLTALSNEICKCNGICDPETTLGLDLDCLGEVFADYQTEAADYLMCANDQVQAGAGCVASTMCDLVMVDACWPTDAWETKVDTECGSAPSGFDSDTQACVVSAP